MATEALASLCAGGPGEHRYRVGAVCSPEAAGEEFHERCAAALVLGAGSAFFVVGVEHFLFLVIERLLESFCSYGIQIPLEADRPSSVLLVREPAVIDLILGKIAVQDRLIGATKLVEMGTR